jgi:hypothetical protein
MNPHLPHLPHVDPEALGLWGDVGRAGLMLSVGIGLLFVSLVLALVAVSAIAAGWVVWYVVQEGR